MSESKRELQIHAEFSAWLRKEGIPFVHCDPTRKATIQPGWPDYTVLWHRRALCIEVKAEKGRLSPEQVECHAELNRTGTTVFIARSVTDCIASVEAFRCNFPTADEWVQQKHDTDLFILPIGTASLVVRRSTNGGFEHLRHATPADIRDYPRVQL